MTTTTDWDVRDRETNDELRVTDVQAALRLDGAATEVEPVDVHELAEALARQTAQTDMLAAENAELRRRLGGWEPRRDPDAITSASDLTERQQHGGLYRPAELDDTDDEGMPLHPIGSSTTWPTWLGGLHHADATLAEQIGGLRSWADSYAALPMERTVVEPVTVDTSYRETEAWALAEMVLAGRDRETGRLLAGPYSALAPERIQDSPADESGQNREATSLTSPERASGRGGGAETTQSPLNGPEDRQPSPPGALVPTGAPDEHDPPQRDDEPDDRVQRMAEGRRRRDALAQRQVQDESGDHLEPGPREPWWRRRGEWLIAAGVFVAWAGAIGITIWLTGGP